jgi:hypothetical protein
VAVLLEKLERDHKLIKSISRHIPDQRQQGKVTHSVEKLLKQRVFTLTGGFYATKAVSAANPAVDCQK